MASIYSTPLGYSRHSLSHTPVNGQGYKKNKASAIPLGNESTKENFVSDPNSTRELLGLGAKKTNPIDFAGIFGNEEERNTFTPVTRGIRTSTPRRRNTKSRTSNSRASIFGSPMRVKAKTPLRNRTPSTKGKRTITPISGRKSISKRGQTPIQMVRQSRLSLNGNSTISTPLNGRRLSISSTPKASRTPREEKTLPNAAPRLASFQQEKLKEWNINEFNSPPKQVHSLSTIISYPQEVEDPPTVQLLPTNKIHSSTGAWIELQDIQKEEQELMSKLCALQQRRQSILQRIPNV